MEKDFATLNASLLASASVAFCASIGIEPTDEFARVLSGAVMASIARWYVEHDKELNLTTAPLESEAVTYAFEHVKMIAVLAQLSAMTGIGMEGFEE